MFEKCSGLKINQAKSEMLWLGSMRHRRDAVCNLQISDDPVYALGVHFTYNTELSYKKNFFHKLGSLKKTLSVWSRRDLSIYGRINIVKTVIYSHQAHPHTKPNGPRRTKIWENRPEALRVGRP